MACYLAVKKKQVTDRHNSMGKSHILYWVKEARFKRLDTVWFPFVCHFIESKTTAMENRSVVAKVEAERGSHCRETAQGHVCGWWNCSVIVVVAVFKFIEQYTENSEFKCLLILKET